MNSDIRIEACADAATIDIEGVIGVPETAQFDSPGDRVATWERFRSACARIREIRASQVRVNIRSTGGDVGDALLIYDALRELSGRVTTRCTGYVASAATVIAQAASPGCREIAADAFYLVHRAQVAAEGTAASLAAAGELLEKTDDRLAAIYAAASGRSEGHFRELMHANEGAGRWLTADEAVEAGLADRVVAASPAEADDGLRAAAGRAEPLAAARAASETPAGAVSAARSDADASVGRSPVADAALRADRPNGAEPLAAAASDEPGEPSEPGWARARPTRTEPVEDPSLTRQTPSSNQAAYQRDLQRLLEMR